MCMLTSSDQILKKTQLNALLKLYHICVVPVLIYDCETWILKYNKVKLLNNIQIKTFMEIFQLPRLTPIPLGNEEI